MTSLVHGEFHGLTWYEIPAAACGHDRRNIPEGVDTVTVIAPLGKFPYPTVELALLATPDKMNYASRHIAFKPIADDEMPDRVIMYSSREFDSESITAWAHANLEIPDTLDLKFDYDAYKHSLHVVASTLRNGSVVKIRKRLDTTVRMAEALAEHMPFLLAKCTRPDGPTAEFTCSAYTAGIIATLTRAGADQLEAWLERHRHNKTHNTPDLALPGPVFQGGLVSKMTLIKSETSNIVRSTVKLTGGHTLEDDATGVEIRIEATLPETLRQRLRGRPLSDLIDAEWARTMRIRTVREKGERDGQISLRAFGENVELAVPKAPEWTDEEAGAHIRAAGEGDYPDWQSVQESAIPILRRLTPQQLASVVSLLTVGNHIDLAQFGQPGWVLRGRGPEIVIESCPSVPYADFLDQLPGDAKDD